MGGRDLTSDLIWDLGSGIGSDRVSTFIAERLYEFDLFMTHTKAQLLTL